MPGRRWPGLQGEPEHPCCRSEGTNKQIVVSGIASLADDSQPTSVSGSRGSWPSNPSEGAPLDIDLWSSHLPRLMPCSSRTTSYAPLARSPCGDPAAAGLQSLEAIVRAYCRDDRAAAEDKRAHWARHSSLNAAVRAAALSTVPSGKRHPHQRRIPGDALRSAAEALNCPAIPACSSFDELHRTVHDRIAGIHRIGELAVYDIACRIGAFLGLSPDHVYLHAGTRKGAQALGLQGATVHKNDLPPEFRKLSPAEVEDCLCIYKAPIRRLAAASRI